MVMDVTDRIYLEMPGLLPASSNASVVMPNTTFESGSQSLSSSVLIRQPPFEKKTRAIKIEGSFSLCPNNLGQLPIFPP